MIRTRLASNKKAVTMQTNQQVTPSKNATQVVNKRVFSYGTTQVELPVDKYVMIKQEE